MKATVTITDITRMAPPFVCLAGVMENKQSIRIQFRESRIDEAWLCNNGVATVRPFARVGFDLIAPRSEPPHTEDWYVDKILVEDHGRLNPSQQLNLLSSICDPTVAAIFGTEILHDPGFYVLKGHGNRSLGTILAERIYDLSYQCYEAGWDARLRFSDRSKTVYMLKVKDLTLCAYLDHLREQENLSCEEIRQRLNRELGGKPCYLRIGLARGWAAYPDRCYLQVTGVYPFPDYLQGRWFADFTVPRGYQPARDANPLPAFRGHQINEAPAEEDVYSISPVSQSDSTYPPQILSMESLEVPALPALDCEPLPPPGLSQSEWRELLQNCPEEKTLQEQEMQFPPARVLDQEPPATQSNGWVAKLKRFFQESG